MSSFQEVSSKYYSPVSLYKDPEVLRKKGKIDFRLIREFFSTKLGVELSRSVKESEDIINDTVEGFQEELGLDDHQVEAVIKKKGVSKLAAVSDAIRAKQFMERYR